MGFLDKAIGFFSPKAELERMRTRMAIDAMRKYDAASSGRRTAGWNSTGSSADREIGPAATFLRNRSRDLSRNNTYAKKAIGVIASNTVGIGIRASILMPDGDESFKKKLHASWISWAETTACDFDGQMTLYGLQDLIMRTVAESGSCIVRKRVDNKNESGIPFQVQVLEPEFLCKTMDRPEIAGGGRITHGIEFDADGKRVAYNIYERHPDEATRVKYNRIPAADVCHVYLKERPGQSDGVPMGTASATKLRDFADYEDAQLMRQKIAACFAVFVQDAAADSTGFSTSNDSMSERVEPGMIEHLPAGKTVQFGTPPPAEGYEPYSKKILQGVAAGYGITYESLTGDLSNVNFSSGRMGWLEMHKLVEGWQYKMMIPMLCDPVWKWFMQGAVITGVIPKAKATGCKVQWTPPRREMVDPVKETNGLSLQVRNGFTSWSETVRSLGWDPKELREEIINDFKELKKNELFLDCDPSNDAAPVAGDKAKAKIKQ